VEIDTFTIDGYDFRTLFHWALPGRRYVWVYHGEELIGESRGHDGVENPRQTARYYAKKWLRSAGV